MNRRINLGLGGCLMVLGVAFILAAGVAWAFTRTSNPQAPPAPPAATVSSTPDGSTAPPAASPSAAPNPVVDRAPQAAALAAAYVKAYKAGRTFGGEMWLRQLRLLASPELVKAVAQTDPEKIVNSDTKTTTVESINPDGTGRVRVTFRDGSWLLLHTGQAPDGGLWVVAVEGSRPT